MIVNARKRAKLLGLPFDLDIHDIIVPEKCPILGLPLSRGTNERRDNSPSLDRIHPSKGYVKGNIQVISNRANRAKSNLTGEELLSIALWLVHGVTSLDQI